MMAPMESGGEGSGEELGDDVYGELRRIAARMFEGERSGHTLQPTALVHEVWLRLGDSEATPEDRSAFLAMAARAMRNALVDHARRRNAEKRGGGAARVTLMDAGSEEADGDVDLLDLDAALVLLAERDPELARIVDLRTFAGLTLAETAAATGMSFKQVRNGWDMARAFLRRELREE